MKFKSQIVTQASGSLGGTTFSHNVGGLYMRARSIPTNPNSTAQQAARNGFGSLATAWRETLTEAQRNAWTNYAANTPVVNALGDPILLSGQQMYIRNNSIRTRFGVVPVQDAPVGGGGANLSPVTIEPQDGTSDIALEFNVADVWANEDDGLLLVQLSRQLSTTINFFRGPFRGAGLVNGELIGITSPATITSPFGETFDAGLRVYARVRAAQADGRISDAQIVSGIVV